MEFSIETKQEVIYTIYRIISKIINLKRNVRKLNSDKLQSRKKDLV